MTTPIAVPAVQPPPVTPPAVVPPPVQADLSPTGPFKGAILASAGSDGSTWSLGAPAPAPTPTPAPTPAPSALNDVKRWAYTAAVGPGAPHEHHPHGMPSNWSWYANGENPNPHPPAVQCMTGWGQVYLAAEGTWVPGIAFDIDAIQSWAVSPDGQTWTQMQAPGQLGGMAPAEDWSSTAAFTFNQTGPTTFRIQFPQGHLGHFWPNPRPVLPSGFAGFAACAYRVRMIVPSGYSGPAPLYIANAGADWWATLTSGPNPEAAQGRFVTIPTDGSWVACDGFSGSSQLALAKVPNTW